MVLTIGVLKKDAEKIKRLLINNNLFLRDYSIFKDKERIFFPVKKETKDFIETIIKKNNIKNLINYETIIFSEKDLNKRILMKSWRELAKEYLTKEEYGKGHFSYDQVGDIAIIEITNELESKEELLAKLLLKSNPVIKTVLKKSGGHKGPLRIQKTIFLAGEEKTKTIVNENGVRLIVDVDKVYYSIRLGTERNRIMKLIRDNEDIYCMFSGVGPYPIVFSKNTMAKKIVAVELNKYAHELALENNSLNKCNNIEFYQGDVKKITPILKKKGYLFDRITMPLPHTSEEFLPDALSVLKNKGVIHYYTFIELNNITTESKRIISLIKNHSNFKIIKLNPVICGQHSPRRYRVCFDIYLEKD